MILAIDAGNSRVKWGWLERTADGGTRWASIATVSLIEFAAVGAALARTLRRLGVRRIGLKWPNDLVVGGAKLGGILIETRPSAGATRVVIGVGINCRRNAYVARLPRRIAFLEQFVRIDRNTVLRACAAALCDALDSYEAHGFAPFAREWQRFDGVRTRRTMAAALA